MAIEKASLTVRFEYANLETQNVKQYRLESSYTTSTDGFSFTLYQHDAPGWFWNLELQPVELLIDGNSQVLGRVDLTDVGGDGSAMSFQGRDFVSDLVECHSDPTLKLKKEQSLVDAIRYAAGPVGITAVVAEDEVGLRNIRTGIAIGGGSPPWAFKEAKLKDYKANPGEGLYAFCNRLAARHSVTIQPGVQRNQLVLSSPNYVQSPCCRLVRHIKPASAATNTVLQATARRDFSSWPTYVLVTGKTIKGGDTFKPASAVVDAAGGFKKTAAEKEKPKQLETGYLLDIPEFDALLWGGRIKPADGPKGDTLSLYRLHYQRDTDSKTQEQVEKVAQRIHSDRLKDSLRYECTVRGHQDRETGATYAVDTIAEVNDEVCGVNERMWIESRTFEYSPGQGATTRLVLWRLGAFSI
jgi:prophage tail gpP-like protein